MKRLIQLTIAAIAVAGIVWLLRGGRTVRAPQSDEPAEEPRVTAPESPPLPDVPDASDPQPLPAVLTDPSIVIVKSLRALTVYSSGQAIKTYRIALGADPVGDKEREGDNRTPEGQFYICTKNADSQYHRALGISYPNEEDAERGMRDGLISSREHRQLLEALTQYRQPSWRTVLGGEIMVHGGGTESDWTQGCIAMADAEAEELFNAIPLGTPVSIEP